MDPERGRLAAEVIGWLWVVVCLFAVELGSVVVRSLQEQCAGMVWSLQEQCEVSPQLESAWLEQV